MYFTVFLNKDDDDDDDDDDVLRLILESLSCSGEAVMYFWGGGNLIYRDSIGR